MDPFVDRIYAIFVDGLIIAMPYEEGSAKKHENEVIVPLASITCIQCLSDDHAAA